MPTAVIDGIATRYEVLGSGPPLLMYAPAGFNATIEAWRTQGVYAKIKLLDHLSKKCDCPGCLPGRCAYHAMRREFIRICGS
jgi:hypothetical protein